MIVCGGAITKSNNIFRVIVDQSKFLCAGLIPKNPYVITIICFKFNFAVGCAGVKMQFLIGIRRAEPYVAGIVHEKRVSGGHRRLTGYDGENFRLSLRGAGHFNPPLLIGCSVIFRSYGPICLSLYTCSRRRKLLNEIARRLSANARLR